MDTKYVIASSKNLYLCITRSDTIFKTKSPRNATRFDNIERINFVLDNLPLQYQNYKWYIESDEEARDECCRYYLHKNTQKSNQNKTTTKSKRINITMDTKKKVFEKYNGKCAICGKPLSLNPYEHDNFISIDHIVPLDKGGENKFSNYQATCCACNSAKTNIMPEVFRNSLKSVLFESIITEEEYQNILFKALLKIKITHFAIAIKSFLL